MYARNLFVNEGAEEKRRSEYIRLFFLHAINKRYYSQTKKKVSLYNI
jgi:hypothetical protein